MKKESYIIDIEHSHSRLMIGLFTITLGILTLITHQFTGITLIIYIAFTFMLAGTFGVLYSMQENKTGKGPWGYLAAGMVLTGGFGMLIFATSGIKILLILLGNTLLLSGLTYIVISIKSRNEKGWKWLIVDGILSLLLGALVLIQWPISGQMTLLIYTGIWLIKMGTLIALLGANSKINQFE